MILSNLREALAALKAEPWAQALIVSWIAFDGYLVAEASHWFGLGC